MRGLTARVFVRFVATLLAFAATVADPASLHALERNAVRPSVAWIIPQLLPSPGLLVADGRGSAMLSWQLTPLLFSFGTHARNPWRSFVVAPMQREGGSLALVARPELFFDRPGHALSGRAGLVAHLPLREAGDTLSWSFGVSYLRNAGSGSAWGELGIHTVFGVFGLIARGSPSFHGGRAGILELSVRYF